jgi:hypothetical protein
VELEMCLFHSSLQWTDTNIPGGFSPHIRFGGFLPIIPPGLNTTILRELSTITNYYNAVVHNILIFYIFIIESTNLLDLTAYFPGFTKRFVRGYVDN